MKIMMERELDLTTTDKMFFIHSSFSLLIL